MPHGTYLELDGSLTDLAGGTAKKLGPIQSVTYRYSTQKIQMLLPYTIAQPLLTNPVAPPPEPTDVAPLASDTFFGGAQPILVTVEGTAWLRRSWWVVYAQMECKPLASAFRPRLTWRAAANEPKGSRGISSKGQPSSSAARAGPGASRPRSSYLTGNLARTGAGDSSATPSPARASSATQTCRSSGLGAGLIGLKIPRQVDRLGRSQGLQGARRSFPLAPVGFVQRSVLISPKPQCGTDLRFPCHGGATCRGRMSTSTLILVLLLTFGVACALDRFARRHNARSRIVDM